MSVAMVLALLALERMAPQPDCPLEPQLEAAPSSRHWLEGTVGGSRVRMYLQRGGGVVTGVYYYTRHWKPLLLAGEWLRQGELRLSEKSTPFGGETATFQGVLGADGLTGQWVGADGQRRAPVRLRAEAAPSCETTGPWQTFDDPSWPVTFSYPGSWHLQHAGNSISLACPDPARMLYDDSDIRLVLGRGLAPFEHDKGGAFARCHGRWFHQTSDTQGTCDCREGTYEACKAQVARTPDGVTVLGRSAEERLYCRGGGYIGLGESGQRLILVEDRWVELDGDETIVARMASTIHRR